MAPEIALQECRELPSDAVVLDPMAGSGTVLRVAAESGLRSVGVDMDPLAVLISSAWTSGVGPDEIVPAALELADRAKHLRDKDIRLPWAEDAETVDFVRYWFAEEQRSALSRLSTCLAGLSGDISDVLRVCLSRLIIAKERGASLARDVSHSRPHKVRADNDYDVLAEFVRAALLVARQLSSAPVLCRSVVTQGDARHLTHTDASFDAVVTSPPYLNAIDYMRGHKLALIWLGHSISELRSIRSSSIGSERRAEAQHTEALAATSVSNLSWFLRLPRREASLVMRYAADVCALMCEIGRVLKPRGKAVLVVGNSCLKGVYIENSHLIEIAAVHAGMHCTGVYVRDLPSSLRYLPTPSGPVGANLGKRMRKECVLSFAKA